MCLTFLHRSIVTLCLSCCCVWSLVAQNCENDTTPPVAICSSEITLSPSANGQVILFAENLNESSYDDCSDISLAVALQGTASEDAPPTADQIELTSGDYIVELWITDASGNTNRCWTEVTVLGDCNESDNFAPTLSCFNGLNAELNAEGTVTFFALDVIEFVSDNCTPTEELTYRIEIGTGGENAPTTTQITLTSENTGVTPVTVWAIDASDNATSCTSNIIIGDSEEVLTIRGQVYADSTKNCVFDANEKAVQIQQVRGILSQGTDYTAGVNSDGSYAIRIPKSELTNVDEVIIRPVLESHFMRSSCSDIDVIITPELSVVEDVNVPIELYFDCPTLQVDLLSAELTACTSNQLLAFFCNYGLETAENTILAVTLDPYTTLINATSPYTEIANGTILFDLGELAGAHCNLIGLDVEIDCAAPAGYAHRFEGVITADNTCESLNPDWNGASVRVTGECDEASDQVRLEIRNIGDDDMSNPMQYIIVEDVILMRENEFELPAGEAISINVTADGTTWRLEAEQVDFHPGQSMPSVTIEGCGGLNNVGLPLIFGHDDRDLNKTINYQQTISTADNETFVGYPKGYSEEHFIEPNTPIEYIVRFPQPTDNEQIIIEV
ncbi:MAG: hypothetical protein AB8G22_05185, partial [Saprospiraceae bacterium]